MAFADTLRKLLDERNMKAADLARHTDLSEAIISNYLSGVKEPKTKSLRKISTALGVSASQLTDLMDFKPFIPRKESLIRTTLAMPEALLEKVHEVSKQSNISCTQLMVQCIEFALSHYKSGAETEVM